MSEYSKSRLTKFLKSISDERLIAICCSSCTIRYSKIFKVLVIKFYIFDE